jgi:hypothetical protein
MFMARAGTALYKVSILNLSRLFFFGNVMVWLMNLNSGLRNQSLDNYIRPNSL